jgi:hypothetical protein
MPHRHISKARVVINFFVTEFLLIFFHLILIFSFLKNNSIALFEKKQHKLCC